jgi:large subunit ribosomal protein L17
MYRNLVTDLLRYERMTTTEAKAKEIRPMAERIITLGKRGDLHARRQALRFVYDPKVVKKVFEDIAPRMRERPGGYLRITAIENRKGDGAKMAAIELVDLVEAPATPRPQRVTAAPTAAPIAPVAAAPAVAAVKAPEAAVEEAESATVDTVEAKAGDGERKEDA